MIAARSWVRFSVWLSCESRKWTKNDIEASKARFRRLYAKSPIEYRFLCGHDIQSEDDEDALLAIMKNDKELLLDVINELSV